MSTISTQLRTFKEPTKDQLTEIFFSIPPAADALISSPGGNGNGNGGPASPIVEKSPTSPTPKEETLEKMEINAVLSLNVKEVEEDSYVSVMVQGSMYGTDSVIDVLFQFLGGQAVHLTSVSHIRLPRP